jgi:hypothetical protein
LKIEAQLLCCPVLGSTLMTGNYIHHMNPYYRLHRDRDKQIHQVCT